VADDLASNTDLVKDLAEACSTQAKIENRTWLGIIATTVVLLVPPITSSGDGAVAARIPFFETVPVSVFSPLAFAMLAILIVVLSTAHAQHLRADALSHRVIRDLKNAAHGAAVTPRDLFDILRVPSYTRVAPLAQLIRGKWQWEGEKSACPWWRRITGTLLYILLKLVALAVLFVTPGIAIWLGYERVVASSVHQPWLLITLRAAQVISIASLIMITLADFIGTLPRIRRFWSAHWALSNRGDR
jgi:hypothetical protein